MPARAMIQEGSWRKPGNQAEDRAAEWAEEVDAWASAFPIPELAEEETGRTVEAEAAGEWAVRTPITSSECRT